MPTIHRMLIAAALLLPLAGGCTSPFAGEWVQESALQRDGTLAPVNGERRIAMQFLPPSTIRFGMYSDASRAVESDSVSDSDYQTIQDGAVALFGAYTARVEDGQLVTYMGGREVGRYRRLSGPSAFPPMVKLPKIVRANPPAVDDPAALPPPPWSQTVAVAVAE